MENDLPPPRKNKVKSLGRKRLRLSNNASSQDGNNSIWHSTPITIENHGVSVSDDARDTEMDIDEEEIYSPTPIVISTQSGHAEFSAVLNKVGFVLGKPRNHARVDEVTFCKNMTDWIKIKASSDESKKFLTEMINYFSIAENLKHSLTPTLHKEDIFLPSLLNLLLKVLPAQEKLINTVVKMIQTTAFTANKEEEATEAANVLYHCRWVPNWVKEDELTKNMLELIEHSTESAQKELLKYLPEVIPESHHSQLGMLLVKLFEQGAKIASLMDCFSDLDISKDDWAHIREAAIEQMLNSELIDYPAFFAFLLRTSEVEILTEIILTIREKLEITAMGIDPKNAAHQIEILEKVRFCIAVNPNVISIWCKAIKCDLQTDVELKPIDLFMLIIFSECSKPAVVLLKSLFAKKDLSMILLQHLINHNMPVIDKLFNTLTKICYSILKEKNEGAKGVAEEIFVNLFSNLNAFEAQEIIATLASILINDLPSSRASVLNIFKKIAEEDPKKLLIFAPHLIGVLEYVKRFPPRQIKELMNILAILAHFEGANPFRAEFLIMLRKHLTHTQVQNRSFGVLAVISNLKQISLHDSSPEEKIKEMTDLTWTFVEKDEEPCSIYFDELAEIIEELPLNVVETLKEKIGDNFQEYWVYENDSSDIKNLKPGLKLIPNFDANKEIKQDKIIIVFEEIPNGMSQMSIPSHFRILRFLEAKVEKDLENIDAILGAPIYFPDVHMYLENTEKVSSCHPSQRLQLGRYLVLAINFFRELISAFLGSQDPELRVKIWCRLKNIVDLQKILAANLKFFEYLPIAYAADETCGGRGGKNLVQQGAGPSTSKASTSKKSKGKGKSKDKVPAGKTIPGKKKVIKKKKALAPRNSDEETGDEEDNLGEDDELETLISHYSEVQPKSIQPYLRRFDRKVFTLLRHQLHFGPPNTSLIEDILGDISCSAPRRIHEVEKLSIETLTMLLIELNQQMHDERIKFEILKVDNLLANLCSHINSINDHFERKDITDKKEIMRLDICFRLLLNTMTLYFEEMKKLDYAMKEKEVQKGITALALKNVGPEGLEDTSIGAKIEQAAQYVSQFNERIKDPSTAIEHIKLLKILSELVGEMDGHEHLHNEIVECSQEYLKQNWKLSSLQIIELLKSWFENADCTLTAIKTVAKSIIPNEDDESKIPCRDEYKTCTKGNFHTWYGQLLAFLAQYVHKRGKKAESEAAHIKFWLNSAKAYGQLLNIISFTQKKVLLVPVLRYGRIYLESFIAGGIKLLPAMVESGQIKQFSSHFQKPNRKIQHICLHSKIQRDTNLMRYVPLMKKVLETYLLKVRECLANCGGVNMLEGFMLAPLKPRNLGGEEINSQPYSATRRRTDDVEETMDEDESEKSGEEGVEIEEINLGNDEDEELFGSDEEEHDKDEEVEEEEECLIRINPNILEPVDSDSD